MIFQDANEDNEWIFSWWKSSQRHVRQFFSFTLAISFNLIQCRKRISKRVSHIFCPTYSSTTIFLAKSFFNHWNVSLGLEKNFILYMWWLVDGSMVFVLYENWNECFQKSKNLSPRTILKGITSVARTLLKQHDEKIVLTFY